MNYEKSVPKKANREGLLKRALHHENFTMLFVLVIIIFMVIAVEFIFTRQMRFEDVAFIKGMNISNVLMQVAVTGILAIGMTLVMLMGGIDLSIGQMMSFIGVGMAYLLKTAGWSEWSVVIAGVAVAVFCQLVMGFIISRTKLEPFIVSLGFMTIYQGFVYLITNGREITLMGKFTFLGKTYIQVTDTFRLYATVLLFILLVVIVWLVMKYTKFGRRVYAVGGNENAAYLSGVNVKNFKLLIYALNGIFVALAAMAQMSRLGTGNPLMGSGKEIDVIAAVVVGGTALSGGKGNIWGTVIGVILLGIISNALNILGVSPHYQYIMKGVLIIVAVLIGYYSGMKTKVVKKAAH